jgi:hypothetical protein
MEEKMLKHLRMQALVLCLALLLAAPVAAKNVILMISDGMGFSTVMATDYYHGEKPVYAAFPEKYMMTTYRFSVITDPRSGGRFLVPTPSTPRTPQPLQRPWERG